MGKKFTFEGGITKYWWIPLITGLLAIGLGVWCLCAPLQSLPVLAYTFAWLLTAAGVLNLGFATVNTSRYPGWGFVLGLGILEVICGVWMLCLPSAAITTVFMYVVGIYLICAVIAAIIDSCTMYGFSNDFFGWILAILLITLFFAVIFMSGPIVGGVAVWMYIGIGLICFGIYRLFFAARVRRINRKIRF